jgi:septal ring factor EnvC (AmiA/AmiB activator)
VIALWGAGVLLAGTGSSLATPSLAALERLDHALTGTEAHLLDIESERRGLVVQIATLSAERAAAEVREREAQGDYQRRLRALARLPAGARAVLLGGVRSLADYVETERILRWIAAHDHRLRDRYVQERQALEAASARLIERQARLDAAADTLRAERARLAQEREERLSLLATLLSNRESTRGALAEQRLAHSALGTLLKRLRPAGHLAGSFAHNRGRLPWPAAGVVGARFGDQLDARFGTEVSHPGIDILARSGTPVQAVAAGEVVYADWLKGYGQIVIIAHGHDYHTLSAHLARLLVRQGDVVAAGALLGTVGDTGSLTGTHLYFELRHDGVPEDPLPWLRQ